MQKTLRKLCLIPVLVLVFAAAGPPDTVTANDRRPCLVDHFACPDPFYDCCCGVFHACFGSSWECDAACR